MPETNGEFLRRISRNDRRVDAAREVISRVIDIAYRSEWDRLSFLLLGAIDCASIRVKVWVLRASWRWASFVPEWRDLLDDASVSIKAKGEDPERYLRGLL